ncbi:MAG: hypothetical protein AAGL68_09885 [Pseudomonadota bacterium]
MIHERPQLRLWLIGLAMFAVLIGASLLRADASEFGIVDHQAAGTAAQVDIIQADWRAAGIRTFAIISMIGDLIFIGVYGWGSYVAGRSFSRIGSGVLRAVGVAVAVAAAVFIVTDYIETTLQLIQLLREQGSDWMAGTAAFAQPIKVAAWIVTFLGVLAGLILWRFSSSDA